MMGADTLRTGNLMYSRLFGQDIIILNSEKIAKDLLENRSKNYSGRPYLFTSDMWGLLRLVVTLRVSFLALGVDWISFPCFCPMAIDGACIDAFSTRRSVPKRCTDFYPRNTARRVNSSVSCSMPPNNSMITCSSKCMRLDAVIDPVQPSLEIHRRGHHEQHVRL